MVVAAASVVVITVVVDGSAVVAIVVVDGSSVVVAGVVVGAGVVVVVVAAVVVGATLVVVTVDFLAGVVSPLFRALPSLSRTRLVLRPAYPVASPPSSTCRASDSP